MVTIIKDGYKLNKGKVMKKADAKILKSVDKTDSQEFSAILKFLELTKEGTYSEVVKTTPDNVRLNIDAESIETDENYFYSIS